MFHHHNYIKLEYLKKKDGQEFKVSSIPGRLETNRRQGSSNNPEQRRNLQGSLGINEVMFTEGTPQDAARFGEVVGKLASYIGTQPWS